MWPRVNIEVHAETRIHTRAAVPCHPSSKDTLQHTTPSRHPAGDDDSILVLLLMICLCRPHATLTDKSRSKFQKEASSLSNQLVVAGAPLRANVQHASTHAQMPKDENIQLQRYRKMYLDDVVGSANLSFLIGPPCRVCAETSLEKEQFPHSLLS